MKILFTNPTPMIKYGILSGFEKHGWETARIEVPQQNESDFQGMIDRFKPDYIQFVQEKTPVNNVSRTFSEP